MNKKEYQICTQCIMDSSDPEITFDEIGVCNHCHKFKKELNPIWFPNKEGRKKLDEIIKTIKEEGKKHDYDCVIGLSGGVDSSYLAYVLKKEYPELRMLAIHIDGGWNSELAVQNIENIVKKLNIDLYTKVMNWEEMKDLQLSYLKSSLANQDVPQDHAFFSTLYDEALKHNIKYFLSGGNIATESVLPISWGHSAMDSFQIKAIQKEFGTVKLKDYKLLNYFKARYYFPFIKFKIIEPLNFMYYHKDEAKQILIDKLDWKDYGGKHHESRFTKFFQAYYLPYKFGYDKRRAHLSSLILAKQLSREEGLLELKKSSYNQNEIESDKEFIAKKLGITLAKLNTLITLPNKHFTDYRNSYIALRPLVKIKKILKLLMRQQ